MSGYATRRIADDKLCPEQKSFMRDVISISVVLHASAVVGSCGQQQN